MFGFPESYEIPVDENKAFDLGNTVVVPVVKDVASRVLDAVYNIEIIEKNSIKGQLALIV